MSASKISLRGVLRRFCISRPQSLWRRYVLGFAFIFATISVSHWASLETIKAAEDDAEVLSVSNRQRMLSQRILFLMSEVDRNHGRNIDRKLEAALNTFETSHEWLITRPDLSPALQQLYFEQKPISLDAFSRRFVQMVGIAHYAEGEDADELHAVVAEWGFEELLVSLAAAADLFRQESEARIARLQRIQQITLISALVVLMIEALMIFLPAQISVNTAIRRLQLRKKLLRKSLSKLKKQNHDLVTMRQHLTRAANHDALTGLLNRRAVYEHMDRAQISKQGADFSRCVMKIDLDHFKEVNDSLGHNAGDAILKHVAEILEVETRDQDRVGRIGGDEFVVLIENPTSLDAVRSVANRIIQAICQPVSLDSTQCNIGASIGYTMAVSSSATPDQLLIEADLALYEAKRAGRGNARSYSEEMALEIETRRLLFDEITRALSEDQFEPYFQPQVFTESGVIYGCEVLARWRHPVRGIVPPATFIAAAEESGLVDQIDWIMIGKGLDALKSLLAQEIDIPCISVNASPKTLRDPQMTERLLREVHNRNLLPRHLTVEVLESTLIENDSDTALSTISDLSRAGFSVVLDDFGTGYASMSNLSLLELNGIKLDQSLIKPVPEPRADSIISALVTLSSNLNMNIVAEGVESYEHFLSVRRLGCQVVQGYGIGNPMPVPELIEWYHNHLSQRDESYRAG